MDTKNFMTIPQAAQLLGISRQRMHQIVAQQGLSVHTITPRLRLISRENVRNLKQKRESEKNSADS